MNARSLARIDQEGRTGRRGRRPGARTEIDRSRSCGERGEEGEPRRTPRDTKYTKLLGALCAPKSLCDLRVSFVTFVVSLFSSPRSPPLRYCGPGTLMPL